MQTRVGTAERTCVQTIEGEASRLFDPPIARLRHARHLGIEVGFALAVEIISGGEQCRERGIDKIRFRLAG